MSVKLTIAIPTYKRPIYLMQAIDSAINQKNIKLDYEIIVVNNDPESDMSDLLSRYKDINNVSFFKNEKNLGMLGNINRCVELAKGEYIAYLHDDDLLLPNYIEEIQESIEKLNPACIIPTRYLLFDNKSALEKKRRNKKIISQIITLGYLFRKNCTRIYPEDNIFSWQNCYGAPSCGVVFKKSAILEHGLFFPEGTYSWDYISFLHLNERENIYIIHKPLSVYRMSTGLSLRPEVQCDFFDSYEDVCNKYSSSSKCGSFIKKYRDEILFLNTNILTEEAMEIMKQRKVVLCEKVPSKVKFLWFMARRLIYYSYRNLNVEITMDNRARKILLDMGILEES